jgi:hypothetical protein
MVQTITGNFNGVKVIVIGIVIVIKVYQYSWMILNTSLSK